MAIEERIKGNKFPQITFRGTMPIPKGILLARSTAKATAKVSAEAAATLAFLRHSGEPNGAPPKPPAEQSSDDEDGVSEIQIPTEEDIDNFTVSNVLYSIELSVLQINSTHKTFETLSQLFLL